MCAMAVINYIGTEYRDGWVGGEVNEGPFNPAMESH